MKKNGNMFPDYFYNYKYIGYDVSWARSVAYFYSVHNGVVGCFSDDNSLGKDIVVSEYTQKAKRTMIGYTYDGTIILACTEGEITGAQEGRFMKNKRCKFAFNLDGGGSTHMYDGVNKRYAVKGDRNVTDAIVVIKKYTPPNTNDPNFSAGCYMKLTGSAARLRADVVNGTPKITIPNGTMFKVVGLYSWKAGDGYRWGWGEYGGQAGYFQYDPAVMNPVGDVTNQNYKMRLFASAARLRQTIRGTIISTVANGSDIKILRFIDGKQSDGYQWCFGSYGGQSGYFQYDPTVMFPTND